MVLQRVQSHAPQKAQHVGGVPAHTPYDSIITEASKRYGVPEKLIKAVIQQESHFKPGARSPCGAGGLMQLMPATARELGCKDRFNPQDNIMAGTKYLASMLQKFDGNVPKAVAAYNAGPGAVHKYGGIPPYRETQNYVKNVMGFYGGAEGADLAAINGAQGASEARSAGTSVARGRYHERTSVDFERPVSGHDALMAALLKAVREGENGALVAGMTDEELLAYLVANNPNLKKVLDGKLPQEGFALNMPAPSISLGLNRQAMSPGEFKAEVIKQARASELGGQLKNLGDDDVFKVVLRNPELKAAFDEVKSSGVLSKPVDAQVELDATPGRMAPSNATLAWGAKAASPQWKLG